MPLYIRHSCCIKIPQFRANSTPLTPFFQHYSTHFPITQNPAIPYFISLFTVLIKLFKLFIPTTPLSRILLHKKNHTSQCAQFLFTVQTFQLSLAIKSITLSQTSLLCMLYYFILYFLSSNISFCSFAYKIDFIWSKLLTTILSVAFSNFV